MTRESRVGNMSLRNRNPLKGEKRGGTVRAVSLVLGLYIAIKAASFFGFINEYWQIIIDHMRQIADSVGKGEEGES